MCRSIKQLRQPNYAPSDDEINAAALQFVRKVSGFRKTSRANQAAFDRAVGEIALATRVLIQDLRTAETQRVMGSREPAVST